MMARHVAVIRVLVRTGDDVIDRFNTLHERMILV